VLTQNLKLSVVVEAVLKSSRQNAQRIKDHHEMAIQGLVKVAVEA